MAFAENTLVIKNNCHTASITDIKPGDVLMTPSGEAEVAVAEKTGTAYPLFKVSSPDSYYTVTKDHVLNLICGKAGLKDVLGNEMYLGQTFNLSVYDYLSRSDDYFRQNVYGYRSTLSFPVTDPGFPPYEFGVILSHEDYMIRLAAHTGRETRVPFSYLLNGHDIRMMLLAGYADGCGRYDEDDNTLYLPVYDSLDGEGLYFLAKSLGFQVWNVDDGLVISGNLGSLPTETLKMKSEMSNLWYEISVEEVGESETYNLELRDNRHAFLLDDFSVVNDYAGE